MECERFKKLLKQWYLQVQDEALAPARMVNFMESHLTECPICMMDPESRKDVKKIITLVLPQDKLKVPSRSSRKTVYTPDSNSDFIPPPPPEGEIDARTNGNAEQVGENPDKILGVSDENTSEAKSTDDNNLS